MTDLLEWPLVVALLFDVCNVVGLLQLVLLLGTEKLVHYIPRRFVYICHHHRHTATCPMHHAVLLHLPPVTVFLPDPPRRRRRRRRWWGRGTAGSGWEGVLVVGIGKRGGHPRRRWRCVHRYCSGVSSPHGGGSLIAVGLVCKYSLVPRLSPNRGFRLFLGIGIASRVNIFTSYGGLWSQLLLCACLHLWWWDSSGCVAAPAYTPRTQHTFLSLLLAVVVVVVVDSSGRTSSEPAGVQPSPQEHQQDKHHYSTDDPSSDDKYTPSVKE